jgi:hypothetical protein
MVEFESLAVLLVRLFAATLGVLAVVQAVANCLDMVGAKPRPPLSYFFRTQLMRPALLFGAGAILLLASAGIGRWLGAGLGT